MLWHVMQWGIKPSSRQLLYTLPQKKHNFNLPIFPGAPVVFFGQITFGPKFTELHSFAKESLKGNFRKAAFLLGRVH